jgi:membrane-bound inhibitor of C-type lysozyme
MRVMLAVLLAVNLVGCVELVVHQPAAPPGGRYVCEDGKVFLVELVEGGSTAAVTYDNRTVTLPQAVGGADAKYSDGRTTLHLDGPRALLETGGLVFARGCVQR